jgi:hypothetical protein
MTLWRNVYAQDLIIELHSSDTMIEFGEFMEALTGNHEPSYENTQ